jgi:hypothetical protein
MNYLLPLVLKYRQTGVLLDTNILLLYYCGLHDEGLIGSFKRIAKFTPDDFRLLCSVIRALGRLVTTPHILAEVSNLLDGIGEPKRSHAYASFSRQLMVVNEVPIPAAVIAGTDCFGRLGLTDTAIRVMAERKYLVITEDFPLLQRLKALGYAALNFNHLRTLSWGIQDFGAR